MNQHIDSITGIASWLGQQLAAKVSTRAEFSEEVVVFKVEPNDGTSTMELAISDEALGDHPPEQIITDLSNNSVPKRLKADPTMRLSYSTDRDIPHLEMRTVVCNGRSYRFVRDANHAVRVFDDSDALLTGLPSPLPILPASLFRRGLGQLCEDIRQWGQ